MISEKYKDLYLSTVREQLRKLSDLLLYLEKKPDNQTTIENIFRLIHSMKGAAAAMGYRSTVKLFHSMENIIDAAYNQHLIINKKSIDLFFKTLETLESNFDAIEKNNKEINLNKEILEFENILKKKARVNKKSVSSNKEKHILGSLPTVAEISISTEKLNRIQNSLDDLLVNVMSIKSGLEKQGNTELLANYVKVDKLLGDVRRNLEKIRIIPLKQVLSSLPYLVREISRDENKNVDFIINDNDLSLDKAVLDELVEILIQLLKNAVSHGIMLGQAKGKINVDISLENDQLKIVVEDNGAGIQWQEILNLAIKNKIVTKARAKKMTIEEIRNLIFVAGISKGQNITTTSGRGVGLSLVKAKVEELDGQIEVKSKLKKGTTFIIHMPLPLSVFRALIFKLADYSVAMPLSNIKEVIKLPKLKDFSRSKSFTYNKKKYNLISLPDILGLQGFSSLCKYVGLMEHETKKYALPIYSNIRESELVTKKTPLILKKNKRIKGVAISAQGQPVLILDINNLV